MGTITHDAPKAVMPDEDHIATRIRSVPNAPEINIILHVATCLLRGPMLATLATYYGYPLWTAVVTWSQLTPIWVFVISTLLVHEVLFIGFVLFFDVYDTFGWLRRYKIVKSTGSQPRKGVVAAAWRNTIFQHAFMQPLGLYFLFKIYATSWQDPLAPLGMTFGQLYWHYFQASVFTELSSYAVHRGFHAKWIYKYFHRRHHRFIGATVLGAEYASELEQFLAAQLPTMAYCAGQEHVTIWLVWIGWRIWESYETHCGYCFRDSWLGRLGLLHGQRVLFHHDHHAVNKGNYGNCMLCDVMFGTLGPGWMTRSTKLFDPVTNKKTDDVAQG